MTRLTGRRTAATVVLAVSVVMTGAACGRGGTPGGPPSDDSVPASPGSHSPVSTSPPGPTSPPGSSGTPGPSSSAGVASRVAYFSVSDTANLKEVVRSRAALRTLVDRVAARDARAAAAISAGTRSTDFSRSVLVAWSEPTGCSRATSAALEVSGDRLVLRVSQPQPLPECFASDRLTVVFEVPKERVPARPVFGPAGSR